MNTHISIAIFCTSFRSLDLKNYLRYNILKSYS